MRIKFSVREKNQSKSWQFFASCIDNNSVAMSRQTIQNGAHLEIQA